MIDAMTGIMQDRLQQFTQALQTISHTTEDGLNRATTSSIEKIQTTEQQLVHTGERTKGIGQSLNDELVKQFDLLHKISTVRPNLPHLLKQHEVSTSTLMN